MAMPDPLRDPFYEFGQLLQQCEHCGWAQRGHICELIACPACAAPLTTPLALEFGGLRATWTGRSFRLADRFGNPVYQLCNADLVGLLPFLCRHAPDDRRGRTPVDVYVERIAPALPWNER